MHNIKTLVTHSGRFHADDLLAYAVLHNIFPNACLIRSREENPGPQKLLFDTGKAYNPEQLIFDHHQDNKPLRDCGTPYSSFGLIWKHFGQQWLDNQNLNISDLHNRLNNGFVKAIDAMDNGLSPTKSKEPHPLNLPKMLSNFNALNDFKTAASIAHHILIAQAHTLFQEINNLSLIKKALDNRCDPRWIELPFGMQWLTGLRKYNGDDVLYVLFPSDNQWYISAVHKGNSNRDLRKPLPKEQAGKNKELASITGVKTATFCHAGRFLASAQTKNDALALLTIALKREYNVS